jgi:hypothetical protein
VRKDEVEHGRGECAGLFNELNEEKARGSASLARRWSSGGSAERWLWGRRRGMAGRRLEKGDRTWGLE